VAVILALALSVRVIAIVASPHFRPINDAADFDRYAVSLVEHGTFPNSQLVPGPTAFRAPLFPLSLAAVYELVGVGDASTRWQAARVFEALLGAVTVALIIAIAARLWSRRVALVAGGIAAVYPPLVLVGSSLMSESLYIPLGLAAVLVALQARERPGRWAPAVGAGVLVGLAALARSTDLILVIPIAWLLWGARPRWSWRALRAPALATVVTALTLVPWTVRNVEVMHTFVPITDESGYALIGTYNSYAQARTDYPALYTPPLLEAAKLLPLARGRNEAQYSSRLTSQVFDYIGNHPGSVLKTGFWNSVRLLNLSGPGFERYIEPTWGYASGLAVASVYGFWVVLALAVAGMLTRAARRAPPAFWLCPVALLATTVFVVGATRYRVPADPWIVMLAALGALQLVRRLRGVAEAR
jgi:4-amino-4-deoxy-L-arabinose transferase-like glycosyltransferase